MTSQNRCPFGRRTLSSCFSAWFRFDMVKTVNNFSILCKNHQWFPVAKQIKNLQISLVTVRNPQWFLQEYFSIFVPISSISCRNHQWFLQEKRHTFFRISRFLPRITNDFWRQKNKKSSNFADFCQKSPMICPGIFFHFRSDFIDFVQKSPMISATKKRTFFQNFWILGQNHQWFMWAKKNFVNFFRIHRFLAKITIDFRRKKNPENARFSQYRGDLTHPPQMLSTKSIFASFFFKSQKHSKTKKTDLNATNRKNENFSIFVPMWIFTKNYHVTRG